MNAGVFKTFHNQDISITDFKAYKSWRCETSQSMDSYHINRLTAIKPDTTKYSGGIVTLNTNEVLNDISSFYCNKYLESLPASVLYYNVQNLLRQSDYPQNRQLYDYVSVVEIPSNLYGEQIHPGTLSFKFTYNHNYTTPPSSALLTLDLQDDGNGNLYDNNLIFPIVDSERLYLGFDTRTYEVNWKSIKKQDIVYNLIPDRQLLSNQNITYRNVSFTDENSMFTIPMGNSAAMRADGYIRIPAQEELQTRTDWAISFWIYRVGPANNINYILSKRNVKNSYYLEDTGDIHIAQHQYPFELFMEDSTDTLVFQASNGIDLYRAEKSLVIGQKKHLVIQRNGNDIEIFEDGIKTSDFSVKGKLWNDSDIMIGNNRIDSLGSGMNAQIDEFYFFNKALSQTEVTSLKNNQTNTHIVGKILYDKGLVILSDPRVAYSVPIFWEGLITQEGEIFDSMLKNVDFKFNSTLTIYEHEYICKINETEFNCSFNKSLIVDGTDKIDEKYLTNDNFYPYFTTIGLYSEKGELLAIGKLSNAIKKRDNVDMNLVVRFDT